MDKFFYEIQPLKNGKWAFYLWLQEDDSEELMVDDVLEFDTLAEAEEYKNNLPELAYHIEQMGDV